MYQTIKQQRSVVDKFAEKMALEKHFSPQQSEKVSEEFSSLLEKELRKVDNDEIPPRCN